MARLLSEARVEPSCLTPPPSSEVLLVWTYSAATRHLVLLAVLLCWHSHKIQTSDMEIISHLHLHSPLELLWIQAIPCRLSWHRLAFQFTSSPAAFVLSDAKLTWEAEL